VEPGVDPATIAGEPRIRSEEAPTAVLSQVCLPFSISPGYVEGA
jgi:hypothetical protein